MLSDTRLEARLGCPVREKRAEVAQGPRHARCLLACLRCEVFSSPKLASGTNLELHNLRAACCVWASAEEAKMAVSMERAYFLYTKGIPLLGDEYHAKG